MGSWITCKFFPRGLEAGFKLPKQGPNLVSSHKNVSLQIPADTCIGLNRLRYSDLTSV